MNTSNTRKVLIKLFKIIVVLLSLLVITAVVSIVVCSSYIKTTQYYVALDGIEKPVRIAIVADTHGKIFGKDNNLLYKKVRTQAPDVIVLLGDLFPKEYKKSDKDDVIQFTQSMQDIAQVFFAMGNHEKNYSAQYGDDWIDEIRNTGAIVFEEECKDIVLNGNTIRIGSSMGHGYLFGRTKEEYYASTEYAVLTELENSPYPTILLAHMPDTIAFVEARRKWHIDLALCAHTHGGVIRIPGKGGLYAPMQGWWPKFDYGEYQLNDQMRMIITSGLSGHDKVPRIFNLPEICVIDITHAT